MIRTFGLGARACCRPQNLTVRNFCAQRLSDIQRRISTHRPIIETISTKRVHDRNDLAATHLGFAGMYLGKK